MEAENKTYLGDGLYAFNDGFQYGLTTERYGRWETVYLDPEVLAAFFRYLEKCAGIKISTEILPQCEDG